jgi:hypothetical protein
LTFALLLGAFASAASTAAWATGEFIQEIRFFSRSGMDTEDNLAYFQAASASCVRPSTTTGCLPPTAR